MHYQKVKGILSANNGMNLYRGCTHGCIYCDSRSECYQFTHDFEDIEVKINALELLEEALSKRKKTCMIGTGSMSDPYQPIEKKELLTRGALEIIEKYGFGVTIITKSANVLRDIDLYKKINAKAKAIIQMTLTTFDENMCKIVEPHVSTTYERFLALKKFHKAGIETVVWMTPILPFINDTMENLQGILNYCKEAKVHGIICFEMGVTLRKGDREYFYQQLDKYFPGMKETYEQVYGLRYSLASPNNRELMKYFVSFCQENHILYEVDKVFKYLNELPTNKNYEQLKLF